MLSNWIKKMLARGFENPSRTEFTERVQQQRRKDDAPDTSAQRFEQTITDERWHGAERLKKPSIMTADFVLRQHERADWQGVDPFVQEFAAKLIEAARRRGVPLYVHSAYRTDAEQRALVARKVSKARPPNAPHCKGAAVDIVHSQYHWEMTPSEWKLLYVMGQEVLRKMNAARKSGEKRELVWGGSWRFYDPAHWELRAWRGMSEIVQGDPIRKTPRKILREFKGK